MSEQGKSPKLLDLLRDAIRTRHYSYRTEQAYVHWVRQYILFHNKRHPKEMGKEEINRFLTHLAVQDNVSASTQNQALSAIVFLYKHVLPKEIGDLGNVIWAKRSHRLPVVLTREEIKQILDRLSGISWLIVSFLYGSGLRLRECLNLRIKDIDFGYSQIIVRSGKGEKDRRTVLPNNVEAP